MTMHRRIFYWICRKLVYSFIITNRSPMNFFSAWSILKETIIKVKKLRSLKPSNELFKANDTIFLFILKF